jgi:small-conductance mechanosensitive channel
MWLIEKIIQLDWIIFERLPVKMSFQRYLYSALGLFILVLLYLLVGYILAIPTDYGRIFTIFMTSMTVCLLAYFFVFQNSIGLLLAFKKRQVAEQIIDSLRASVSHETIQLTAKEIELFEELLRIVREKNTEMRRHEKYVMYILFAFTVSSFWIAFYHNMLDGILTTFLSLF